MENHREVYDEKNNKTSPTQGMLSSVFQFLNIASRDYSHSHKRGVFIYPLFKNYDEFLCDKVSENDLIETERDWGSWWFKKSQSRLEKLTDEKRVLNEPLFHEHIKSEELEMFVSVRGVM